MASYQDGEQAPLLQATHHVDNARESSDGNAPKSRLAIIVQCLLLLAFVGIGKTLITRPINQIQEDILCHKPNMNDTNALDSFTCEHDELSLLRNWTAAFESIMSFLTAAPCGMAADIYGRKRILQVCIAGIILAQAFDAVICRFSETFPIHLMGLKGLWSLLGGGSTVFSAMMFTIASDISLDAQSELLSYPILLALTYAGSWISIYAGFGCLAASFLITLSLPETRVPDLRNGGPMMASETRIHSSYNFRLTQFITSMAGLTHRAFTENKKLGMLIVFCVFTTMGNVPLLVAQQSSQQPDSADIPILMSIFWSSILKVVLLTMILPLINHFLIEKLRFSPLRKDLAISRASIVALVAGSLGIAIAKRNQSSIVVAGIYVYALGCGYNPAIYSLLSLVSGGNHIGILYANIGAMQSIGTFIAGLMFGVSVKIWEETEEVEPIWIDLDYLEMHVNQ
ncbi:major facilitator superfamily domain-containing protein [Trichoderma asperelloides]|nr:major facilitator superfamily domain-containing protein [Trichoderma asperelloides]